MASTLRFDNWEDSNGTPILDGSNLAIPSSALPTGSVLQVACVSDGTNVTTASTSFTPHPNLSVSITPGTTSNKVLVRVVIGRADNSGPQANNVAIFRNGSRVNSPLYSGDYSATAGEGAALVVEALDSPATTSAVTYEAYIAVSGGTGTYRTGSITVMEVAG